MPSTDHQHADVSEDLIEVVLRADRRGFCRWRVATALGISAAALDAIERRAGLPISAPREAHEHP